MLKTRRAEVDDAYSLAGRLRGADRKEILAVGRSPLESLLVGLRSPDPCYVAVDDEDVPQVIWGTHPSAVPFLGYVWMMATDGLNTHWMQVLRETRAGVAKLGERYPLLANAVHKENVVHIRWLRWAGFTFIREYEFNGATFIEFAKITAPGRCPYV